MADERGERLVEIGRRIKERREELGLTQEDLGRQADLSKSRISEIEKGSSAANGLAYLGIAEGLGVRVEWLLTGKGPSRRTGDPPSISARLSQLAEAEGWSHRLTVEVATALNAVVARRTGDAKPPEYSSEQIIKIAEALKESPER